MINLRYHIVSITAVFLALAIGLALGSTLIQRGIVDTLETRLDELGDRLDRTDGENAALRDHLEERDDFDARLLAERLPVLAGHLTDRTVLVLAAQGTDDDILAEARESLQAAGATVSGTLVFTPRWERLTPEEIDELGELLGRRVSTEEVARTLALRRMAEQLHLASQPAPEPDPPETDPGLEGIEDLEGLLIPGSPDEDSVADSGEDGAVAGVGAPAQLPPEGESQTDDDTGDGQGGTGDESGQTAEPPPVPDADLISRLVALGYLEFFPESAALPLPGYDLRYVMIADDDAVLADQSVAIPFLQALVDAAEGPVPIVVAAELGPAPDPGASAQDHDPVDRLATLIGRLRNYEALSARVTTVDSLDGFEGQVAMVLAIAHLDEIAGGHYGRGLGAQALWPARP